MDTHVYCFLMILKIFPLLFSFQDVYFDDESAEVVISSLRLGDEPDG
jgi:hypothetical protein